MLEANRIQLEPLNPESARQLGQALGLSPTTAQLLVQRGLVTPEAGRAFLEDTAEQSHDPYLLKGLDRSVELLRDAIARKTPILIHGDYDVDGISATVLLYELLTGLGGVCSWHVPDRISEGYGVSVAAVEACEAGLLLTADCGSSSLTAVEVAHRRGLQVIITDHHNLPARLPEPDAFINPQFPDCPYPNKALCGTGVAYKLAQALAPDICEQWLDLVALATIADVVSLLGENRGLVRSGLARLGEGRRPGLKALAQVAGLEGIRWQAWNVAFGLAPRLNAAGRLAHAGLGVELLLCQDPQQCQNRALHLDTLNQERRAVEAGICEEVLARVAEDPDRIAGGVLVENGAGWHPGVVGIVASRMVERFGIPALIMGQDGDLSKGSGRTPENLDLYAALSRCAHLFVKFGGHSRAAGFTLESARIDDLRSALATAVAELRTGPAPVRVDLTLPLDQADLPLAREITRLEPLGEGNRRPLFLAERVKLEQLKTIGSDGTHLRFMASQNGVRRKAVAFRQAEDLPGLRPDRLYYDLLYYLEEDTYDGFSSPSLLVQAVVEPRPPLYSWIRGELRALPEPSTEGPTFLDLRNVLDRRGYLRNVLDLSPDCQMLVGSAAQAERTADWVERELGQRGRVTTYEDLKDSAADLLLLTPPWDIECLSRPEVWSAQRVHCLFGDREWEAETHRYRQTVLDRTRMEAIWKALNRHGPSGSLEFSTLTQIERQLSGLPASREALIAAVDIFEELGLAVWESSNGARRLILQPGRGRRLEESLRFQEFGRRHQKFVVARRTFTERDLRLRERLRGA